MYLYMVSKCHFNYFSEMFVEIGTTDLVQFVWFLDTGGHDYWLYKATHARNGWLGFGMALNLCV